MRERFGVAVSTPYKVKGGETMLVFLRQRVGEMDYTEVSRDEALNSLLTTYKDNAITRDMLKTAGSIPYRYGEILVKEE